MPSTGYFSKFLKNIREHFDKISVERLIGTCIKCIQTLNLESAHDQGLLEALYSSFLVSSVHEEFPDEELLLHYRES